MPNLLEQILQIPEQHSRHLIGQRIRAVVDKILVDCHITHAPVPVDQIAKLLGIVIRESPADDDISGALIRADQDSPIIIALNEMHHPNRKRFTIAHELGHLVLHKGDSIHVDQNVRVNWRNQESSSGVNWKEVEANRFAAALLMPTQFLTRDIETVDLDDADGVSKLARRYKVSEQAMRNRLVNIGVADPF